MESNVSLIVLTIVLVLLVVILPVYNIFTRQDDMSYNIALKAVTNFVDEARTTGRIAYSDYDNLINQLGITKNSYQIEIEVHKNYYLSDDNGKTYVPYDKVDYTNTILEKIGYIDNENKKTNKSYGLEIQDVDSTKEKFVYSLERGDRIYIRVKNTNITKADSFLSSIKIMDSSSKIDIDYGGVVLVNSILE